MRAIKIIVGIILALILVVAIGAFFLYKNLDGIAEKAIENIGSDVTQTQVDVSNVKLQLKEGRGEIAGLSVANPKGFSENKLLNTGTVAMQIKPSSLRDDVIVLEEVVIDGAKLRLEHQGLAETNIKALLDNIQSSLGNTQEPKAEDTSGPQKRFMIEKLRFTDISMDVVSPQIENRTLALKDIERQGLGTREQGLTGKELALAIARPLLEQAREKFESEAKGRAQDKLKETIDEKLSDEDKEKVDKVRSLFK